METSSRSVLPSSSGSMFDSFVNSIVPAKNSLNTSFFNTSSKSSLFSSILNSSPYNSNSTSTSSIGTIMAYVFAVIIVMFCILLFIHFFITPIFQLRPGTPGFITIPGGDDGVEFWKNNTMGEGEIKEENLPIKGKTYDYSLLLDIKIPGPIQPTASNAPRIILARVTSPDPNNLAANSPNPNGDTINAVLGIYNFAVALQPDTNDIIVSVLGTTDQRIVVENVPMNQTFRLGIIVMEKLVEVYMNGQHIKTKKYDTNIRSVLGNIKYNPASQVNTDIVSIKLLKIWKRVLTTSEIKYATPALDTSS